MSHQYYDRGGPYGVPNYDRAASPGGRPPRTDYSPSGRQQRPPPLRVPHPRGPPPQNRGPMRPPPPQQYAPPRGSPSLDNLYDGSAYGGADEFDQWPLPAFAPSGRNSPGGRNSPVGRNSPGGRNSPVGRHGPSGRNSPGGSPRRFPPPRPQRPDYQDPILDPPRPTARIAPADRAYRQGPPPPNSHHGSGQWTGDGYRSPQPPFPPPSRPPPQAAHPPPSDFQQPQALQQAVYGQRNQRAPLGPPPSARRGPGFGYPPVAPVHPIAEETDSMRGSIRNASVAFDPAHSSYASSNAIPIGIPGYYLEDRGSGYSHPSAVMRRPSADVSRPSLDVYDEPPLEPMHESGREWGRDDMESPSPEPAALIRQASLGKRTKPTLTTVKSGERMGRDGDAQGVSSLPSQQRNVAPPKETTQRLESAMPQSRISASSSEDGELARAERSGQEEKALEAASAAAVGMAAAGMTVYAAKNRSRENLGNRTPSSDILSSGTGLLDPSSDESEKEPKKRRSKELLGAMLGKDRSRSRSRSPLSLLAAAQGESMRTGAEREPGTPDPLDSPAPDIADLEARRRPPRLDIDAVRDAEARGSLTSLPDLIRRATKLASNLDRGRTASRLGMNFFEGMDSTDRALAVQEANRRSGSISDILTSFPAPGSRDGVRNSLTHWNSNLRHSHLPSDSDAGEIRTQKKRKCCGMPVWLFVILLIVVFLLIAAAVLVPVVLLIILPGQDNGSHGGPVTSSKLASCEAKLTCHNGGTNVLANDGFCRCLCINGYTGSTCTTHSQAGCTTISVGSTKDASVGNAIPRLLDSSESDFGIPLDGPTLLGLFSSSDMSCTSQNALVTFSNLNRRSELRAAEEPTPTIQERHPSTATSSGDATSSGILYQSGTPTSSPSSDSGSISSSTLDFARVAILYVFQDSAEINSAATAQENLQIYFSSSKTESPGAAKNITLGNGYSCDLPAGTLTLVNGTTIGH